MRRACQIVVETLEALRGRGGRASPRRSSTTLRRALVKAGAKPAFLGYRGYPATLCISVNKEVVHGIPSAKRKLKDGDIVGLDLGCIVDGFYGDAARTVGVGAISAEAQRLMKVTRGVALRAASTQCRPASAGVATSAHAVQAHAEAHGYSVVREFVGHGIGTRLHEEPQVPNYGPPGRGSGWCRACAWPSSRW